MCRLFAFKARNKSKVHYSLVAAENALVRQSKKHPDGWGVAYYQRGVPHMVKSLGCADENEVFQHLSQALFADTVIAHVRRRTQGEISIANCHPFQQGQWVMAHNGDVPGFKIIRDELIRDIAPELLVNIFGTTDSEVYCAVVMHELNQRGIIDNPKPPIRLVAEAVRASIKKIEEIAQRLNVQDAASLNIVLSNGSLLLAYRQGRELNYSCYSDEEISCTSALSANACVNHGPEGCHISHILISSEPLTKSEVWTPFLERQIVALDSDWRLWRDL